MPAENKTAPADRPAPTLEGQSFRFENDAAARGAALDHAFDYRGDVTLQLADGTSVTGFLSNREPSAPEPFAELWVKDEPAARRVPYSQIVGLDFSGDDKAFGKSWDDWQKKGQRQREAEAQRLLEEARARGEV